MNNNEINLEVQKAVLAGLTSAEDLHESVELLAEHYNVEDRSPNPIDVAKEMQKIMVDNMSGVITDQQRDDKLRASVAKALASRDKLGEEEAGSIPASS